MRLDLHVHSTASDGTLTPAELVERSVALGLHALSITDHDSIAGIDEARSAATGTPLLLIPGVELSTTHNGRDVHVLGYFVNPDDESLQKYLAVLRDARSHRAHCIIEGLRAAGFDLSLEDVLSISGKGSVGRSHIARALVARGHAADIADAFERLIGRDCPFYAPKPVDGPARVISTILDAGGVPVLAHPGVTQVDDAIPELVDSGLIGLEAFHAEHTPQMRERYHQLARDLGLIVTGGSDFHGPFSPGADLGSITMPDDVFDHLLDAAKRDLASL